MPKEVAAGSPPSIYCRNSGAMSVGTDSKSDDKRRYTEYGYKHRRLLLGALSLNTNIASHRDARQYVMSRGSGVTHGTTKWLGNIVFTFACEPIFATPYSSIKETCPNKYPKNFPPALLLGREELNMRLFYEIISTEIP
jgi:hypothetical protein